MPPPGAESSDPWLSTRAYWWGVGTGAAIWFGAPPLVMGWVSERLTEAGAPALLGPLLLGAWLLAGVTGSVTFYRRLRGLRGRGSRATRSHFRCRSCGYAWAQLDLTPILADEEARRLEGLLTRQRRIGSSSVLSLQHARGFS